MGSEGHNTAVKESAQILPSANKKRERERERLTLILFASVSFDMTIPSLLSSLARFSNGVGSTWQTSGGSSGIIKHVSVTSRVRVDLW